VVFLLTRLLVVMGGRPCLEDGNILEDILMSLALIFFSVIQAGLLRWLLA
jgi:hypothetical protein